MMNQPSIAVVIHNYSMENSTQELNPYRNRFIQRLHNLPPFRFEVISTLDPLNDEQYGVDETIHIDFNQLDNEEYLQQQLQILALYLKDWMFHDQGIKSARSGTEIQNCAHYDTLDIASEKYLNSLQVKVKNWTLMFFDEKNQASYINTIHAKYHNSTYKPIKEVYLSDNDVLDYVLSGNVLNKYLKYHQTQINPLTLYKFVKQKIAYNEQFMVQEQETIPTYDDDLFEQLQSMITLQPLKEEQDERNSTSDYEKVNIIKQH